MEMRQALASEGTAEEAEPTGGNGHGDRAATNAQLFGDDAEPTAPAASEGQPSNAELDREIMEREKAARAA